MPGSAADKILVRLKYTENRTSVDLRPARGCPVPASGRYVDAKRHPEGPGRHGHDDPVHLARRHDRPRGPRSGRRRRGRRARSGSSQCPASARSPSPSPRASTVTVEPEVVRVNGPRGDLEERKNRAIEVAQEDGAAARHAPDRPRRAPRPARAHALAGGEHGRGRHHRLREDAWRSRASATAPQLKGRDLELALGYSHPVPIKAPEGIEFEVPEPDARRSSRATPSSRSARSPRSSASSARRSPTRARASATRASTSPGRSVSAHDRHSLQPAVGALECCCCVRAKGGRLRPAPAHQRLPLKLRHPPPAPRRRRRLTRWPSVNWMKFDLRSLKPMEQARQGRRPAGRACERPSAVEYAVFDRGANQNDGAVRSLAEGARDGGLIFQPVILEVVDARPRSFRFCRPVSTSRSALLKNQPCRQGGQLRSALLVHSRSSWSGDEKVSSATVTARPTSPR